MLPLNFNATAAVVVIGTGGNKRALVLVVGFTGLDWIGTLCVQLAP